MTDHRPSHLLLALACLVAGCSFKADVHVTDPGIWECKDLRDGEIWQYDNTQTPIDAIGDLSGHMRIQLTDTQGNEHTLFYPEPDWLKCKKVRDL